MDQLLFSVLLVKTNQVSERTGLGQVRIHHHPRCQIGRNAMLELGLHNNHFACAQPAVVNSWDVGGIDHLRPRIADRAERILENPVGGLVISAHPFACHADTRAA